jgi:inorganic triphosphatase YgiF
MPEIELKLGFPLAARARLETHPALVAARITAPVRRLLVSTYHDTPDQALRRAGAALRIRRDNRRWIQTFKRAGTAIGGLHAREEAEWIVPADALDPAPLAPHLAALATSPAAPIDVRRLRPVFTTRFRRTAFDVDLDGTRAEVAIDIGGVTARGRTEPICEIEIELKSGDPLRLFDLAIALAADIPFTVRMPSKAERGYALGRRVVASPVGAEVLEIDRRSPARVAAAEVVAACLEQMQANAAGAATRDDPEFLHQFRVGARRLRVALAALPVLAPHVEAARVEPIVADLRWLFGEIGPARDADVWSTEVLPRMVDAFADPAAMAALVRASAALRRQDRSRARAALGDRRHVVLQLRVGQLVAAVAASGGPSAVAASADAEPSAAPPAASEATLADLLPAILVRRRKRLRRGEPVDGSPDARHAARIAAKKLRYTIELFAGDFGRKGRRRRLLRRVKALQAMLGDANDATVAMGRLDRLAAAPRAPDAAVLATARGWLAGYASGRLSPLPDAWGRAFRARRFW